MSTDAIIERYAREVIADAIVCSGPVENATLRCAAILRRCVADVIEETGTRQSIMGAADEIFTKFEIAQCMVALPSVDGDGGFSRHGTVMDVVEILEKHLTRPENTALRELRERTP